MDQPEADDGSRRGDQPAGVQRRRRHPGRHAVGDQPAERGEGAQRRVEDAARRSSPARRRPARPPLASSRRRAAPSGRRWRCRGRGRHRHRGLWRGPACRRWRRVAMTRPAPSSWASWTARLPTPPAAACTTTVSPGASRALVRSRCHAVVPCSTKASAVVSSTSSGSAKVVAGWARACSAYPPSPSSATTRRPSAVAPDDLGPWDERDLLRRQVVVGGLVGVGVVDAGREDVEQHEAAVSGRCRAGRRPRGPPARRSCAPGSLAPSDPNAASPPV